MSCDVRGMLDLYSALSGLGSAQFRQIWNEGSLFSPISTGTCSSAIGKIPQLLPTKRYKIRNHYDGVFSLNFTDDGSRLGVGYGSGVVTLNDPNTAKMICCPSVNKVELPVTGLQFRTKDASQLIYCLASGQIYFQNVEDENNIQEIASAVEDNEINTLDVSGHGFYFVTAGKDRNIRVYDWENFKPFSVLGPQTQGDYVGPPEDVLTQHGRRIFSVRFAYNNPYLLVSGGWDNAVKVWDLRTSEVVRSMCSSEGGPKLCGDALAVRGDYIVTGSLLPENSIELWSIKEGRSMGTLPYEAPHLRGEYILVVKFCGDSDHIIAGSATCHDAQIISLSQKKVVSRIDGYKRSVSALAVSDSGRVAVAGSSPYISLVETMTTPFFLEN